MTEEEADRFISELKQAYPNPISERDRTPISERDRTPHSGKEYCVGGSFCRQTGTSQDGFPIAVKILFAIQKLNPKLNINDNNVLAKVSTLIVLNDRHRNYEAAYACLRELLTA